MPIKYDINYFTETFVGTSVDIADQVQAFCQSMYADYPDTFSIVSTDMIGTLASAVYVLVYTA